MANEHDALMRQCEDALAEVGVTQKGGKKYMMVKDRMTFFRRAYGLTYGISTQLIFSDDLRVQVQATVTDEAGRTIGSGLAEEIRGGGGVNKASALENCESSAIGRALASLGLHGGEYPTIDEIESDRRSSAAIDAATKAKQEEDKDVKKVIPQPVMVAEDIPFDAADAKPDWRRWVSEQIAGFHKHKNLAQHKTWVDTAEDQIALVKKENNGEWSRLLDAWQARKQEMQNKGGFE